ncbi:MAG: protein kinase, partial [bacterium]
MIGKTISHYKILEKLGAGGMGEVFRAEDTKLDRQVALKFLPPDYTEDPEVKARFRREAKAAAALNHPSIVTIHEIGEHEGQSFLVMEHVAGESLKTLLAREELSIDRIIEIGSQICEGLAKAHEADVVHRDIKPDNILIDSDGRATIADCGLAKLKGVTRLTKEDTTMGTVYYMSPEQTLGLEVDRRSDIFSFGVVLYEMITGHLPFGAEYEAAISYSIVHEEPEPLARYKSGVSEGLQRIVDKALDKDRETRYQHIEDLLTDLKRERRKSSETITPLEKGMRTEQVALGQKRTRTIYLSLATITVIFLLLAGYWFMKPEPRSLERIPIAVVDFINETDETELNGLSGMLITALEQSRRLSVLPRSRLFDILKQLGKPGVDHIDESLGKEICNFANVTAMAIASIRRFGEVYTIDLKILDTKKNQFILTSTEKGKGHESVPDMIDHLAESTRKGFKEKAAEIAALKQKVAEVTTPNLEAYQHYFLGEQWINRLKFKEAEEEFKRAIAL